MSKRKQDEQLREMSRRQLRRRIGIAIIAVGIVAATWVGIKTFGFRRPPNVLFITLDTTRADRLGCYGYESIRTPNLDAIAASGARFDWAFSAVPLTLPSHATMLTGLYPPEHGCRSNGKQRLPDNIPSLPEIFRNHGYDTAAFIASFVMADRFGLGRGFDLYDDGDLPTVDDVYDDQSVYEYRRANVMTDLAIAWLDRQTASGKPFFSWVHYYDPHRPYHYKENPYDNEVMFMDQHIGRLVAHLRRKGLLENTLIVAVGDHGEGLGDHGEDEHALLLINSLTRVPMFVSMTGRVPRGRVVDTPVSLVDVFPTILEFCGFKQDIGKVSGESLIPLLAGKTLPPRSLYVETECPYELFGWSPLYGIVSNDWKYIQGPNPELYRYVSDVSETNNLIRREMKVAEDLRVGLDVMKARMVVRTGAQVKLDSRAEAVLTSLGYLGGAGVHSTNSVLRDPMQMTGAKRKYVEALAHEHRGEFDSAERMFRELTMLSPESYCFHEHLAALLCKQQRYDEARRMYAQIVKDYPDVYRAHYSLGTVLAQVGEFEEAIVALKTAIRMDSSRVRSHNNLGVALLKTGKVQEAVETFIGAIKIRGDQADIHNNLGSALLKLNQPRDAEKSFRDAIRLDPKYVDARFNLGLALIALSRREEAIAAFEETLQMRPDHALARKRLESLRGSIRGK